MGRILDRDGVVRLAREARAEGQRVVFTNGCFDVLHRGHVDLLASARSLGDLLVVGVNDDASVRRLKGPDRPWMPLEDRARILAALAAVDAVVEFAEDTPRELIEALAPDVLVKGGDYRAEDVVGRETVEARGGRVVIVPQTAGRSSSALRARMQNTAVPGDPPNGPRSGGGSVDTASDGLVA